MICWYCHWGWPKPVADIYRAAVAALDGDDEPLLYGPAHVVWSDENWHLARSCLADCDRNLTELDAHVLGVVRRSLEQLAALPETAWNIVPNDYDGAHPENYPPPAGVEMIDARTL